ncbi:MAG: hypothetical protein ACI9JN_000519 [Bacteroidia bacterium]|jgi:hypothetical protein
MTTEYYDTKQSVEEYIHLAKDVNGLELIQKLKTYLPLKSKLLELGTGPGTDWHMLSKDFDTVGSDDSNEFLHHLNSKYPAGTFEALDAITIKTDQKFDGI